MSINTSSYPGRPVYRPRTEAHDSGATPTPPGRQVVQPGNPRDLPALPERERQTAAVLRPRSRLVQAEPEQPRLTATKSPDLVMHHPAPQRPGQGETKTHGKEHREPSNALADVVNHMHLVADDFHEPQRADAKHDARYPTPSLMPSLMPSHRPSLMPSPPATPQAGPQARFKIPRKPVPLRQLPYPATPPQTPPSPPSAPATKANTPQKAVRNDRPTRFREEFAVTSTPAPSPAAERPTGFREGLSKSVKSLFRGHGHGLGDKAKNLFASTRQAVNLERK